MAQSLTQIFLVPTVIAAVTAFGLMFALLGDGVWDAASWGALLLPLVVIGYCGARPRVR